MRQLEGRLANALAAQQDVNKAGAARLASIFRNRERRAVRHAWLSLRATMYVAVDVAAYKAMEKERREAEAARIQAVRNAAEHQIALDAADAARAAAERNNANIVEDARAQLDAAEALRSNLSDGLEAARAALAEARARRRRRTTRPRTRRPSPLTGPSASTSSSGRWRRRWPCRWRGRSSKSTARERDAALAGLGLGSEARPRRRPARERRRQRRRAVRPRRRAGGAPRRRRGPRAEGRGASYEDGL